MASAAPARKPYRKAPPQHRESRHALPTAPPPPAPQPDINQVIKHTLKTPPHPPQHLARQRLSGDGMRPGVPTPPPPLSDSELEVSSLSSLELCTPPPLFRGHIHQPSSARTAVAGMTASGHDARIPHGKPRPQRGTSPRNVKTSINTGNQAFLGHGSSAPAPKQAVSCNPRGRHHIYCTNAAGRTRTASAPRSILKQPTSLGVEPVDIIRKSKSVEMLDDGRGRSSASRCPPTPSLDRVEQQGLTWRRSSSLPSPVRTDWNWRMQALQEKVRFSNFLDEITCRVLSPARLTLLGRSASKEYISPASQRRHPAYRNQQVEGSSADRTRRWDNWVAALQRPGGTQEEGAVRETAKQQQGYGEWAGTKRQVKRGVKVDKRPLSNLSLLSHIKEALSDSDRIRILQQQNEDLRRRLSLTTHKMEAMEAEFDSSRHYMEAELSRTRDDLDKMRDKFRRLQNSYTASQRANQDLEEKLHALAAVSQTWVHALRKVERDKKTMDQEIVQLTNKLLEAKNTIDHLEELNERYRQDCNLAVQLLKCNKSHFRNHKFADLPSELQDMLNKHMKSSLPERGPAPGSQDPDTLSLTPADVVPTSVIARVLEKPEPLVLNSAQSSSCGRPVAEDVFVHVDMTGPGGSEGRGRENGAGQEASQQNGSCRSQSSLDEEAGGAPSFEKLNPYPAPPPPHPLYPGRKVIEFSSDDKVKIPKNSPLPNCTYATRQAISLSLVQNDDERLAPGSPAPSSSSGAQQRTPPSQRDAPSEPLSSQSSPFSSPPQAPSVLASSGSSEEDLLANWQRMFVEKMAPSSDGTLLHRTSFSSQTAQELQRRRQVAVGVASSSDRHRAAYSDGEEGSSARSWTPSRGSSLDTDTDTEQRVGRRGCYGGRDCSEEEGEQLLMNLDDDGGSGDTAVTVVTSPGDAHRKLEEEGESSGEERDILPHELPVISTRLMDLDPALGAIALHRPQKSPKRMGVHHLHRKDSLTRAQEQGTLLD
ncbi:tight junction-associated protein 1 isoform X1 [Neolamprologus brichardi]|uniref:tight junction-associated protein 1 isoform X1 n=1 Tax=Neolamprologus brichardi TaxID=32507 RepID=UPI0003EBB7FE|nr:tight junction-associated protein 1 isoform X1 [Neolamprologus brichardi]